MSFGIIIKNGTKHFAPHFNRTMGKYYGDKHEYLSDMKKQGMEPYNPENVKKREKKSYTPSTWARKIVRQVESTGHVSGNVLNELRKANVRNVPTELLKATKEKDPKGGWF